MESNRIVFVFLTDNLSPFSERVVVQNGDNFGDCSHPNRASTLCNRLVQQRCTTALYQPVVKCRRSYSRLYNRVVRIQHVEFLQQATANIQQCIRSCNTVVQPCCKNGPITGDHALRDVTPALYNSASAASPHGAVLERGRLY